MSKAPRLTKDRNFCIHCGHEENRHMIEDKLAMNEFSVSIICQNCKTSTEYYISSNGYLNHRYAKKKKLNEH